MATAKKNSKTVKKVIREASCKPAGKPAAGNKSIKKKSSPALCGAKKIRAVELLKSGLPSEKVAQRTGFSRKQVCAFKAHITMGTY